jgi:hypothetical protein
MGEAKETSASAEPTEQKRRRKSSAPATEETPAETAAESEEDDLSWTPKVKDWGSQLEKVDTIIRDQDSKQLFAFLLWKNGKRSRVALETCYDRCPKQVSLWVQDTPTSRRLIFGSRCFNSTRTICKPSPASFQPLINANCLAESLRRLELAKLSRSSCRAECLGRGLWIDSFQGSCEYHLSHGAYRSLGLFFHFSGPDLTM